MADDQKNDQTKQEQEQTTDKKIESSEPTKDTDTPKKDVDVEEPAKTTELEPEDKDKVWLFTFFLLPAAYPLKPCTICLFNLHVRYR